MPTIITRGAASATGFGFAKPASGGAVLNTVTFTSNGTWVAPSGVTLVNTLTGKGQDGSGPYWTDMYTADGGTLSYVERTAPAGISSSTIESRAQAEYDKFPSTHSPGGSTVNFTYWYYFVNLSLQYPRSALVRLKSGFPKIKTGNGWGSTYTTPPANDTAYDIGNMEEYVGGSNGANSSALGYTFPGGAEVPANPLTYTNVAVTSGSSYSIIVPSGGYVTLQYYS